MNAHRTSAYFLVAIVIGLIALGLVMMSSTSAFAPESRGDANFLLNKQVKWLGIGLVLCVVAAVMDHHLLQRSWWLWFGIAVVLLVLCYVPGIRETHYGASRWIKLGIKFQPSELAKLAGVVAIAWSLARTGEQTKGFLRGFALPLACGGILVGLILPQVDLGTGALLGATTVMLMFVGGAQLRYLVPVVLGGLTLLGLFIAKMPERSGRFLAFLYPEKYPADAYQAVQGLLAFGSGGVEGLGLGNGRQKMLYLPFAHTDFIFPVIGEELGLRCTLAVVVAFLGFLLCGASIALRARDQFGMLLAFGITLLIGLQAAINIGVTTAVLPNKGMPLPFISYGGTNLVFCLIGVGILLNIYRQGLSETDEKRASRLLQARIKNQRRVVRL